MIIFYLLLLDLQQYLYLSFRDFLTAELFL